MIAHDGEHNKSAAKSIRPNGITWRFVLAVLLLIAAVVAAATVVVVAREIFVILILAVLFAILLTRLSRFLRQLTKLPYQACLAIVVGTMFVVAVGTMVLIGSRLQSELSSAVEHINDARRDLKDAIDASPTISVLIEQTPIAHQWISRVISPGGPAPKNMLESNGSNNSPEAAATGQQQDAGREQGASDGQGSTVSPSPEHLQTNDNQQRTIDQADDNDESTNSETGGSSGNGGVSQAAEVASTIAKGFLEAVGGLVKTTFGLLVNVLLIIFVGLFLAVAPSSSRDGVVKLAPVSGRDEVRNVMNELGDRLWRWLVGRFASMVLTGTGVGVALGLLGIPMPITLGILTGLLTFIPNIGAAIALGLALFMALPSGLATMGWVLAIYIGFQLLESYGLTPLIQQYQVDIPPALLISAQGVLGVLLGFLGAMIASPVVVVFLVLHDEVYQRRILNSRQR